jgi:hypothetical protein
VPCLEGEGGREGGREGREEPVESKKRVIQ